MNLNKIICSPTDDRSKRFLLGKKGRSELLAIGLNPSFANESSLDPTSRNIQIIANQNGCDGWWIVNLYPARFSKPKNLPKRANKNLLNENLITIKSIVHDDKYNIKKILCCWGNNVESKLYLKNQVKLILNHLSSLEFDFYCIGKTKLGNPFHPSPQSINRFLGGINQIRLKEFK